MAEQLSAAERGLVERLCGSYRHWAPDETQPPLPGPVLRGGYNNLVMLINGRRQRWVLRVRRAQTEGTSDCSTEIRLHLAAAQAGIAPQVYFSDPRQGVILMEHIDNAPHPVDDPDTLQSLAELLKKIHRLPPLGATIHSPAVLRGYQDSIQYDSAGSGGIADILKRHADAIAAATHNIESGQTGAKNAQTGIENAQTGAEHAQTDKPVLCHNDLLRPNWRRGSAGLIALDWEYAAPGDRFFDIAVCSSDMPGDAANTLLKHYLQRTPQEHERERLRAQTLIYRCIEACWYSVYHPASPMARRSGDALEQHFLNGTAA